MSHNITSNQSILITLIQPKNNILFIDKQYVIFGCIRVINIVFVSIWWNFSQNK